jgi:hypothetical protein
MSSKYDIPQCSVPRYLYLPSLGRSIVASHFLLAWTLSAIFALRIVPASVLLPVAVAISGCFYLFLYVWLLQRKRIAQIVRNDIAASRGDVVCPRCEHPFESRPLNQESRCQECGARIEQTLQERRRLVFPYVILPSGFEAFPIAEIVQRLEQGKHVWIRKAVTRSACIAAIAASIAVPMCIFEWAPPRWQSDVLRYAMVGAAPCIFVLAMHCVQYWQYRRIRRFFVSDS